MNIPTGKTPAVITEAFNSYGTDFGVGDKGYIDGYLNLDGDAYVVFINEQGAIGVTLIGHVLATNNH